MNRNRFFSLLSGKFHLEFQVKYALSLYFYGDSNDWLKFYIMTHEDEYQRLSFTAKRFIALRMSIECLLKSILISLSKKNEKAEDIYKVARKSSHKLEILVGEAQNRSSNKYKICKKDTLERLKQMDALSINIRYDVDFKVKYKKQTVPELLMEKGPVFDTVLSDNYHKLLISDMQYMSDKLKIIQNKRFKRHMSHRASRMDEIEDYIKQII